MEKPSIYFAVLEACKLKGCPVCFLLTKTTRNYIKHMLYESVNDGEVRALLRLSLGLCRMHASMMTNGGDYLGIAIIYQDILGHIRRELQEGRVEALSPLKECPVCSYQLTMEFNYVEVIAGFLHENELRRALTFCGGLCLVHLPRLLALIAPDDRDWILKLHIQTLGESRGHLSEFLRKQDIQFQNESVSLEETMACEKAIDCLVGKDA